MTGSSGLATSRSYQYDLDGNRTRRVEGAVTSDFAFDRTDVATSQQIGATTKLFSYDRFGNLLQSPDAASVYTTNTYDEANRLTGIAIAGGQTASFTLDALDRHQTRTVGAATDTYGYVGPAETTFETSSTGSRSLLDADGSRLAVKNGSTVAWLIFDLHGSVAALCPAGGSALSDAYRYDGWGQTIASWSSGGATVNPWKYRGLLGISPGTTDLLYDMGARDYSPSLGTFTQFDSVQGGAANPATMNRYLYALANPATLVDPDGHAALEDETCSLCARAVRGSTGSDFHIADSHGRWHPRRSTNAPAPICDRGCETPGPTDHFSKLDGVWVNSNGLIADEAAFRNWALHCWGPTMELTRAELCDAWKKTREVASDSPDTFLSEAALELLDASAQASQSALIASGIIDVTRSSTVVFVTNTAAGIDFRSVAQLNGVYGSASIAIAKGPGALAAGFKVRASVPAVATGLESLGRRLAVVGAAIDLYSHGTEAFARDRSIVENLTRTGVHTFATQAGGWSFGAGGAAAGGAVAAAYTANPLGVIGGAIAGGFGGAILGADLGDRLYIAGWGL